MEVEQANLNNPEEIGTADVASQKGKTRSTGNKKKKKKLSTNKPTDKADNQSAKSQDGLLLPTTITLMKLSRRQPSPFGVWKGAQQRKGNDFKPRGQESATFARLCGV